MVTELAVRMDDGSATLCTTIDEFCSTQYTKEMAFQDMGKVSAGWAEAVLVFLFVLTRHEKCLEYGPKRSLLEMLNLSKSVTIGKA